ncbi:CrcB family protein [Gordonia caeni]|uniref:Fluoride-specific ion channel FluC n=1 Tax=Gordonia caeni TaxID=1007097 RepID=A0ABP7PJF4_9ACTN
MRPLAGHGTAMVTVFLGGLLGAPARYGVDVALPSGPDGFPWSTFTVNLVGAFALGLLLETLTSSGWRADRVRRARLLLGTGFLGAFTTYSSFAVQFDQLGRHGQAGLAAAYAAASLVFGLTAAGLGLCAAQAVRRLRGPDPERGVGR